MAKSGERTPSVLLIGGNFGEGVTSNVAASGRRYISKVLLSSADNWRRILHFLEDHENTPLECVVVKLTESAIFLACMPEYRPIYERLIELLHEHNHIVFVYGDNLKGEFTEPKREAEDYKERMEILVERFPTRVIEVLQPHISVHYASVFGYQGDDEDLLSDARNLVQSLLSTGLRVAPYETRANLNVAVQEFLEETFGGLLMRIYIPHERIWASEVDKMLSLFSDYLQRVNGYQITLGTNRTDRGLVYEFFARSEDLTPERMELLFQEFATFLELTARDPVRAAQIVRGSNIPSGQLQSLVTRYAKEARRLQLDIEQERERKFMAIRHRFESELLDLSMGDASATAIKLTAPDTMPLSSILYGPPGADSPTYIQADTVVIGNAQLIERAEGIIAQELRGNIEYNDNDNRILELIREHASEGEALEIQSSLDLLKDTSAPQQQRRTAWQRVRAFLAKHSATIGKVGVDLLEKYLEHLLTGG